MINKSIITTLVLLATVLFITSCDDMNSIQSEYADKDERIYLGKVDSIKSIPGFGRAKITWYIGSDPKIEQTIIYWNHREDSIVKNFVRTSSGGQRDSVIIENLLEGSTLFEFRNTNNKGETSLFTSATVTSWGSNFADGLRARTITSNIFEYEQSKCIIELSPTTVGDSVIYSQIVYFDNKGVKNTLKIEREINSVELTNFSDGTEFHLRNVFFLPLGMDTVYSDYLTVKAPIAKFENGKKLMFAGDPSSRFSEHTPNSLYEWNQAGDLILYELNEKGSFVQSELYSCLVPRDIYREFFFYDDNKFIGVGTNNQGFMFQIENQELALVKSDTNKYFGSGFDMPFFLPARGFFYTISATGEIEAWYVNNNATLGNPTNTSVDTNFLYDSFTLFDNNYLIAIDAEGCLWSIPISSTGLLRGLNKIGIGWNKFVKLISVGQKLIAVDGDDFFYEFDFNATDYYWVVEH